MTINGYSSGFNASNAVSLYQNSSYREEEDSSEHLFDLNRQPSSNSMEFDEQREFTVIKLEKEEGSGSSMVIEEEGALVTVKDELSLENSKKLLRIHKEIKERIKHINPGYNRQKEVGIENCLPCTISFYNWIQSGSPFPEAVDPYAKPLYEHMFPANGSYYLLLDPFLDKLNNPKTILELDEDGKSTEYICLAEDRPLTFHSVPLTGLKKRIEDEIPWKQYENGTETFKLGILFLNHRDDDSKGHFLNFLYCKTISRKKGEADSYTLYIIDPQSKKIFNFKTFLKDYQFSYADDIKIWSGQNQINFNCNKTVKDMAKSLKTEEPEDQDPVIECQHTEDVVRSVDSVARKTTLKIQLKRNREEDFESEITKKAKQNNHEESTNTDLVPEQPIDNHWERIFQMQCLNKENSRGILDQNNDVDQDFLLENKVIEMPVHKPLKIDLTKKGYSKDSIESFSETSIEDDVQNNEVEIVINTNSIPNVNANHLTAGDVDAEYHCKEGFKYFNGYGVEQDLKAAFTHYKLAADQGNAYAQNSVGFMYSKGQGVDRDFIEASKYYKLADDQGIVHAKFFAGLMHAKSLIHPDKTKLKAIFKYCKEWADRGNVIAQYKVGKKYFKGHGTTVNSPLGLKYFRKAAKQNYADAQYECGKIYIEGRGQIKQDVEKAFHFLTDAAQQGHVGACAKLGKLYFEGKVCKQNIELALKYIMFAVGYKDSTAHCTLGKMYLAGQGVERDLEKGLEYLRLAIAQKNDDAKCTLGKMYLKGEGVELNIQEGLRLICLAADHGIAAAEFNLGRMYSKGKVVGQDFEKSHKFLNLASEKGHAKAAYKLGCIYFKGEEGIPQCIKSALTFFEKAAHQGHAEAQGVAGRLHYENKELGRGDYAEMFSEMGAKQGNAMAQATLGRLRLYGTGIKRNDAEALKYSLLAAEQGDAFAQGTLGDIYLCGYGVEKNYDKALMYCRLGAAQNDALAQCILGYMYGKGLGVEQDFKEAFKFAKLSADQGNASAQNNIGIAYFEGEGIEQNYEEAIKYVKLSSNQGVAIASNALGKIYFKGEAGVQKDIREAIRYFDKAADKGHAEAQGMLGRIYFERKDKSIGFNILHPSPLYYSKKAAEQGNAMGQGTLGMMYLEGKEVPQNIVEGLKYINLAVAQGDAGAQRTLGLMLIEGKKVPKNISEGLKLLKLAGKKGDADALYALGEINSDRKIVPGDVEEAIEYYKPALEQGCEISKAMLDEIDGYFA